MSTTNIDATKKLSFEGIILFIGIDVHQKSWKVTIRLNGRNLATFSMSPDAEALKRKLEKDYPEATYHTVYEAGFCGFYIHRQFTSLGIYNIIVNPADIPSSDKDKKRKTDTHDSRKFAEELEKGGLNGIHIPTSEQEDLRAIHRQREQFKKEKRRLMQQIRSHFALRGITLGKYAFGKRNLELLKESAKTSPKGGIVLRWIATYEHMLQQIKDVTKEYKEELKRLGKENELDVLQSVPGVGIYTSETLIAELIHPSRFKNDNALSSYVGLIPDTNSSGENEVSTGITKRRRAKLRHVIIEAAWIASKKDPELALAFNRLCSRMRKTAAITRIAKKLLLRIKRVWTNMETYKINVNLEPAN